MPERRQRAGAASWPRPSSAAVRPGNPSQQLFIKDIAVGGNVRQQRGQPTDKSCVSGPFPVTPEPIRIVPGETARPRRESPRGRFSSPFPRGSKAHPASPVGGRSGGTGRGCRSCADPSRRSDSSAGGLPDGRSRTPTDRRPTRPTAPGIDHRRSSKSGLVERRSSIARSNRAVRLTATPASRTYNGIGRTHSCAYGSILFRAEHGHRPLADKDVQGRMAPGTIRWG